MITFINRARPFFFVGLLMTLPVLVFAQAETDINGSYITPPDYIAKEVLAPRHQNITLDNLSPDREYFLNRKRNGATPLSYFAKPHYNLGGLQIDAEANRRRSWTTLTATVGLELIGARKGVIRPVEVPENASITHPKWSPDGSKIAWFAHFHGSTHLYVTDVKSGKSKQITRQPVLATLNSSFNWTADSKYIFTVLIPENRQKKPVEQDAPKYLEVRKTSKKENRLRTYPSLLNNQYEADLLEYYGTGQLAKINVKRGKAAHIGEPALINNIDADPVGNYVIVQILEKPFSYIVPVGRFAWKEEIWDMKGNVLADVRNREAREGVPNQDNMVDYDRRNLEWRPDGKGLSFLLEPDKEERKENTKVKNRVVQWHPPFGENDFKVIYESGKRLSSVSYTEDAKTLFLTERRSGKEHLYAISLDNPDSTYTIYRNDRNELYQDPGRLMQKPGKQGVPVVRTDPSGRYVFLSGTQYFENVEEKAPRPFIDRVEIQSGETERIFQSSEDVHEEVIAVLDDDIREIMVERQSSHIVPDSWLYELDSGQKTQLTQNEDYNIAITQSQHERFKVRRSDGFEFWVDVILPQNWNGERLPGFIWHYPREYDDQHHYNESLRRYNKNRYPTVGARSASIMVKQGYAVILPDWPITGNSGTSNDNFVWSVVQNSTSLIDALDKKGYIDRDRMAIGGHSYGAFGTANAMIHTSLFKAGIAGAGNYNRTLTPMGFQRERSNLWQGQDRYMQMSPILWADRLDGALLMYHGEQDQNVGTWPTNTRRMFHALNGLGKNAAMYMYPYEAHGPAAKETLLDLWARWIDWLDYHVKGVVDEPVDLPAAGGGG